MFDPTWTLRVDTFSWQLDKSVPWEAVTVRCNQGAPPVAPIEKAATSMSDDMCTRFDVT